MTIPSNRHVSPQGVDVVIPVYGCEESIADLVRDISASLGDLCNSIILVDDGGPDTAWELISSLTKHYPVVGLRLTLNSGQHYAIRVGLEATQAEFVAVMDCDHQDDPSFLREMILECQSSGRPVIGIRQERASGIVDSCSSRLFEILLRIVSGGAVTSAASSFSVIPRRTAMRTAIKMENGMHYLHAVAQVSQPPLYHPYSRRTRSAGKSSYSLGTRLSHAARGVTRWTIKPIYTVLGIGIALLALAGLVSLGSLVAWIIGSPPPGWTTLVLLTNFVFAIQMILLGTVGLYVGALFEIASRPTNSNVEERVGQFRSSSPRRRLTNSQGDRRHPEIRGSRRLRAPLKGL